MVSQLFDAGSDDVLYLVDLSGYVFRAYHAISPLSSPAGEPTQAVFGTVNMLERLLRQRRPKLLAVAMDSRTTTFRKERYPAYKANRPAPPDDLKQQMKRVAEVVRAFPLPCLQLDGFEADDVIATMVRLARQRGWRTVIVSADKDLMQLVGPDVLMWDTMRDKVIGPEEVSERFGVGIEQVRDVLALTGDSSDNIPGVPSVGPKTACTLLNDYGDLNGIYANLEKIARKKLRETLLENRAQAYLSQELVTLIDDVPLDFEPEALKYLGRNVERLRELYTELGFTRQLAALTNDAFSPDEPAAPNKALSTTRPELRVDVLTNAAQLSEWTAKAADSQRLVLYPLAAGPSAMRQRLIGLALCCKPGEAAYIPLTHGLLDAPSELHWADLKQWAESLSGGVELAAHDAKELLVLFAQNDVSVCPPRFDSRVVSYLLDSSAAHTLEALAQTYLGQALEPLEALLPRRGRKKGEVDELGVDVASRYCGERANAIFMIWEPMLTRLEEERLTDVWLSMDQPLCALLAVLEQRGILLDTPTLKALGTQVRQDLQQLEQRARVLAGKEFNVHSPKQLEKLLFDDLGLKPIRRTKTSRSTDAETLEALSDTHELPAVVLEIRQLAKLLGTYIESLPSLVHPKTGRLHTQWHQDVAATGRLSSSDPNLQNIPIRSELGRRIRRAFIAPTGYQIVSADYSQIELRVLAHLSEDPTLVDAFQTGQDIHLRTAMEIFEVDADEVDAELRRRAKAVNFGVIYGQGDSALGKSLGIPRMEASQFIAAYFRRYAGVRRFMDETLQTARASGNVRTLFGRRRLVGDINHANRARRLAAERIAMNTPIQGTAADLLKLAMLRLQEPITPGARMLLTVHDELVFEVPIAEVEAAKAGIKAAMEDVYPLRVPLVVDVGAGANWSDAH